MSTQCPPPRGLDDLWRERVSATQTAYIKAKTDLDRAIRDSMDGIDIEVLHAAQLRHDYHLQQYMDTLRVFRELVLNALLPDEPSPD